MDSIKFRSLDNFDFEHFIESRKHKYEFMNLEKIDEVINECPVAIVPAGLLEWHGNHNAIGLDGTKANYICERAIRMLGNGALFPMNWVGTYGFIRYKGTVCYDEKITELVFLRIYQELMKIGFKIIVILTGHYGEYQMNALNAAVKKAEKFAEENNYNTKIFGWKPPDLVPWIGRGGHAGIYETAMLMRVQSAYGLKLVDLSKTSPGKEYPVQYKLKYSEKIPVREPKKWKWSKDVTDPKKTTVELGEIAIKSIASALIMEILEVFDEVGIKYRPSEEIPEPQIFPPK